MTMAHKKLSLKNILTVYYYKSFKLHTLLLSMSTSKPASTLQLKEVIRCIVRAPKDEELKNGPVAWVSKQDQQAGDAWSVCVKLGAHPWPVSATYTHASVEPCG
jgi:hypothetical protein